MGEDGYGYTGAGQVEVSYSESEGSVFRAFTIVKKDIQTSEDIGIRQVLPATLDHPRRVAVSFRAKAGKPMTGVPIGIGYSDGTQSDGAATFDVRPQWDYHLLLVTIDYPSHGGTGPADRPGGAPDGPGRHVLHRGSERGRTRRSVRLRLGREGPRGTDHRHCRSPVRRTGWIRGLLPNLYATRNVSVAGTLTAGDGDGFASTFTPGASTRTSCATA